MSNETENTEVWFDDVSVIHHKPLVAQATDYEAFGSVLREQTWVDLEVKYRYGYQSNFSESDDETSWQHYKLREYDRIIGRWTTVDPKREFSSPYVGMGNNPISKTDKDGGCTTCPPPGWARLLNAMRSGQRASGSPYFEGSVGFGFGLRSKTGILGGNGLDVGADAAHGLFYFGNRRIGFQSSLGVATANGDYKGQNYSGGEYYFSRGYLEYDFNNGLNGDVNFNQYRYDIVPPIVDQTELLFDKTPANNIDAIGPEIGFGTNFFKWIAESVKSYVNEKLEGLTIGKKIQAKEKE